jgi:hypothetical protein
MPTGRPAGADAREIVELWIRLSRSDWSSLILVPADPGDSTTAIARTLADIGQRLSYFQVTAITVESLEYGSALALADIQQQVDRDRRARSRLPEPPPAPEPAPAGDSETPPGPRTEALVLNPPARLVISIPPILSEPLGLNATHEADAVIVLVRMGRSHLANVRRTVELIGRERVMGCILSN